MYAHRFPCASALAVVITALLAATNGWAATLVVSTTADVVADDGRCSLREAISAANHQLASGLSPGECPAGDPNPTMDVIRIPRGVYGLSLGPIGDDANQTGDLDVVESVQLEGDGARVSIIESRFGDPDTVGDGDRLFHVDPPAAGGVDVVFRGLTLRRGDTSCSSEGCQAGGAAVDQRGNGTTVLESCRVLQNVTSCSGPKCGGSRHAAPVWVAGGGDVLVLDTRIEGNEATCSEVGCHTGSPGLYVKRTNPALNTVEIHNSRVRKNLGWCTSGRCRVEAAVIVGAEHAVLSHLEVRRNDIFCDAAECDTDEIVDVSLAGTLFVEHVRVKANSLECLGESCDVDELADFVVSGPSATLHEFQVVGNRSTCVGFDCDTDDMVSVVGGDANTEFSNLHVARNRLRCEGESCDTDEILDVSVDRIRIADATIRGNRNTAIGLNADVNDILDLSASDDFERGDMTLERVHVTRNRVQCEGSGCAASSVLDIRGTGRVALLETRVTKNTEECYGFACTALPLVNLSGVKPGTIEDSTLERNAVSCLGPGAQSAEVVQFRGVGTQVVRTDILSNATSCDGTLCNPAPAPLVNEAALVDIVDSRVSRNTSLLGAGALHNVADSSLILRGVEVSENVTGGRGGAIVNAAGAFLTVLGSELRENRASIAPGAILNFGSILNLTGTRFIDNEPAGPACVDERDGSGCP